MLRAWRDAGGRENAGPPRRSNTQAAAPHSGIDLASKNARLRLENEPLHMEREILKNTAHLLGNTEMKFRLIQDLRDTFPDCAMCDVLGVSAAGYYAWRSRPESHRKAVNRALLAEIRRVHSAHRGDTARPRVHASLRAEGIRRAAAASNGSCVITASGHECSDAFGCAPRTAITTCGSRRIFSNRPSWPRPNQGIVACDACAALLHAIPDTGRAASKYGWSCAG
jgi:hypothetical protein